MKVAAFYISPRMEQKEISREEKSNEIVTGTKCWSNFLPSHGLGNKIIIQGTSGYENQV